MLKHFGICATAAWLALTSSAGITEVCAPPQEDLDLPAPSDSEDDRIQISAGEVEFGREGKAQFTETVEIVSGERRIRAKAAEYDTEKRRLNVKGPVEYRDGTMGIKSDDAELDGEGRQIRFIGAGFDMPARPARGTAEELEIRADRSVGLEDVRYTTCPSGKDDWELQASQLDLDVNEGFGSGRNIRLEFKGVPILYLPYISFPISNERKSGFLIPDFQQSDSSGTDISLPYYFNLAPNYDLTLTPRILTKRGFQLTNEFRYLLPRHDGYLDLEALPSDSEANRDRSFVNLDHRSLFGKNWRLRLDLSNASDTNYFEDLGSSLSATSRTHLDRRIDLELFAPNWTFLARLQAYQTIDNEIDRIDRPYQRLPQLALGGSWQISKFRFDVESELVSFDRDVGVTGQRLDAAPTISLPMNFRGIDIEPGVTIRQTNYLLNDLATQDLDDSLSRSLPVASLDVRTRLERQSNNGRFTQTLEPRALYVHIPHDDQDAFPVFDTIQPDFNLVQLFRKYRFLGPDRIVDTDQASLGVTTRWIDNATGREQFRATLGQTRYFSAQGVTLPGEAPTTADTSDYIAEVGVNLWGNWNMDVGFQWNSGTDSTTRSETRLQYLPGGGRILNLSYRYRKGSLEQGDLSFAWPAGGRWNLVGRFNYSFRERTNLERFLGVEYEACCWRLRVVARRYISRRTGESDNSLSLQLELKGLTSVGDPADKLLERGILGYREYRDN